MLTIKTIPVLSRMISKIDIKPIIDTMKSADIFSEKDLEGGKLKSEKALEFGTMLFASIAPQLGDIGEDIPEFVQMYKNCTREEAEQMDFFGVLTEVINDEGIRGFSPVRSKRK